ncbi:MAG: hypothetical protein ABIN94_17720 [Ferruginibacter sp.]
MRKNFWLKVFNVRQEEAWLVKKLFLLQFFQGAGIAFFFTASFAMFLEKFVITKLPLVMILSAALLWLTGIVYSKLEHRLPAAKLSAAVTIFMTVSMFAFWLGSGYIQQDWFFYGMLAWFNVLYLLNNLEFWGIAAILFDVRQSKRLFGVISAGDIPSKFIGYSVALVVVSYTGTANLILAGIVFMLGSLYYLWHIHNSGLLQQLEQHHPHKEAPQKIGKLVKSFSFNTLIRQVAGLSFLISSCMLIINYAFYSGVKHSFGDNVQLAQFIAFFFAASRFVSMIIKTVFASRLIIKLGIHKAALLTPIILIITVLPVALSGQLVTNELWVIYFFGIAAIAVDALRTSVNAPALLTLMQPLPTHDRLRAHNVVKGIMDPFANLFSGILLLVIFSIQHHVNLATLSLVLVVLALAWIVNIFYIKKSYLKTLFKTVGSSYFNQEGFSLDDEGTQQLIQRKIQAGTEVEIINILRLLNSSNSRFSHELIVGLLTHSSDKVQLEAIHLTKKYKIPGAENELEKLVQTSSNPEVISCALQALCRYGMDDEMFVKYMDHPASLVQEVAIANLLKSKKENLKERAEHALQQLYSSADHNDRIKALAILTEVKSPAYYQVLNGLMNDPSAAVSKAAMEAAGKLGDLPLLSMLISLLPYKERQVLYCLQLAGESALPVISAYLFTKECNADQHCKLIALTGKIGGSKSEDVLLHLLHERPLESANIIKALYRCRYHCTSETHKTFEEMVKGYILYGVQLLHMQQILQSDVKKYELLMNSLQIELQQIREVLLCLFGCLYHHESMGKVRAGLNMKNKEGIANAMEIIEMMVRKDFAGQFNTIFEKATIDHRCDELKSLLPANFHLQVETILNNILAEKPINYNHWTKACSMYISKKNLYKIESGLLKKYLVSDSKLLQEIAQLAM